MVTSSLGFTSTVLSSTSLTTPCLRGHYTHFTGGQVEAGSGNELPACSLGPSHVSGPMLWLARPTKPVDEGPACACVWDVQEETGGTWGVPANAPAGRRFRTASSLPLGQREPSPSVRSLPPGLAGSHSPVFPGV